MELASKVLVQIAFNTGLKIKESKTSVIEKSTHGEFSPQALHANSRQFKLAVIFLNEYDGFSNVTNENKKPYFTTSKNDEVFSITNLPPRGYELESSKEELKRTFIESSFFQKKFIPL